MVPIGAIKISDGGTSTWGHARKTHTPMTGAWIGYGASDPACPTAMGAYANRAAEDAVERLIGGFMWPPRKAGRGGPRAYQKRVISLRTRYGRLAHFTPERYRAAAAVASMTLRKIWHCGWDYPIFHPSPGESTNGQNTLIKRDGPEAEEGERERG